MLRQSYGERTVDILQEFGQDGLNLAGKYGDDLARIIDNLEPTETKKAVSLINSYGDDALEMFKEGKSFDEVKKVVEGGLSESVLKTSGIKTWDEILDMLTKEGVDENKISEILSTPKGSRPDPATYLSKEYIDSHLSHFQDGVTKIKSKAPVDTEGVGLGTFVMPKSVADEVISQAGGDVSRLEELLGLNPGDLGTNPVRVDIPNPQNIRIPSGNEAGAWPGYWTPGGVMEAVIDPVPKTEYIVTENILGK